MHAKQHPAFSQRGLLPLVFLLGSSGCALLANIGTPGDDEITGSKIPDRTPVKSQREGGAPEPQSSPKTCLADTSTDLHNCGFCGHDCGGAKCEQGLCVPAPVVATEGVRSLVVDQDRVFFATKREVRSCSVGTQEAVCSSTSLVEAEQISALLGQIDGDRRGDNNNSIGVNVNTNGGWSTEPLDVRALALYGDRFFAADQGSGVIVSCPKTGCTSQTIAAVRPQSKPTFAGGLGIDSTTVAWGDANGIGFGQLPASGRVEWGELIRYTLAHDVSRIEMVRTGAPVEDLIYRGADGVFSLAGQAGASPKEIVVGSNLLDFAFDTGAVYIAGKSAVVRFDRATRKAAPLAEIAGWEVVRVVADTDGVYASIKTAGAEKVVRIREKFADTLAVGSNLGPIGLSKTWLYVATDKGVSRVAR